MRHGSNSLAPVNPGPDACPVQSLRKRRNYPAPGERVLGSAHVASFGTADALCNAGSPSAEKKRGRKGKGVGHNY